MHTLSRAFFTLLFTASLIDGVHGTDSCTSKSFTKYVNPDKCGEDFVLYGSEIAQLDVSSKAECTAKCNRNDQCQSVNYEESDVQMCELSTDVPETDGYNMESRTDVTYYVKEGAANSEQCARFQVCSHLESIEYDVQTLSHRHANEGWFSKDPLSSDDVFYFMTTYSNAGTLYYHPTEQDYIDDTNRASYSLPVGCDGAQGLVYNKTMYCAEYNQPKVLAFDIPDVSSYATISFEDVEGHVAGRRDQCYWSLGHYTDIDIASDEFGVWVIWGRYDQSCYLALSKINTHNKTIEKNYFFSTVNKRSHGQAFMVCGVLYVINNYNQNPSWIRYTYNTHNDTFTSYELRGNAIMFPTKHARNAMTNYYHNAITGERAIYMWDYARQIKMTVNMANP